MQVVEKILFGIARGIATFCVGVFVVAGLVGIAVGVAKGSMDSGAAASWWVLHTVAVFLGILWSFVDGLLPAAQSGVAIGNQAAKV